MNEAKEAAKRFFGRNDVFAEVMNHMLCSEKCEGDTAYFSPGDLRDLEGMQIKEGGRPFHIPKERDLMRAWVKEDEILCILALGLEYNPVYPTEMRYRDALTYYDELGTVYEDWAAVAAEYRKYPPIDGSVLLTKMLTHIPKEEKLIPVLSITLNLMAEKWNAPTTIAEMVGNPVVAKLVQEWEVRLLDPYQTEDDACGQFQTELRTVLPMLKYRQDPERRKAYFGAEIPGNLSPEAMALLRTHGYPDLGDAQDA